MTKGKQITRLINEGASNDDILILVDTTLNSIRWYRSKIAKAAIANMPPIEDVKPVMGEVLLKHVPHLGLSNTVGRAAQQFGLMDELKAALVRIDAERFFEELTNWSFHINNKAASRFGCCKYSQTTIEVSSVLVDKPRDFRVTFFHECAHALDKMLNGKSSHHGAPWQRIMANGFGLNPQRCGDKTGEAADALRAMRANKKRTQRIVATWVCEKCGHEHHLVRRTKRPASSYKHVGCGGQFRVK